jgi:hypothetical protein
MDGNKVCAHAARVSLLYLCMTLKLKSYDHFGEEPDLF